MNTGLIYIIMAEFFWALELIWIRKFFPTQNALFLTGLASIISTLLYLPTLFFVKEKITVDNWFAILILGILSYFLPQIFYIKGIQQGPSAFAIAVTTLTMPTLALIMSFIFFKESINLKIIFGSALMIVGFLIISIK